MEGILRPDRLKEALEIVSKEECTLFAGGTDLMVKNKSWPGTVPDLKKRVVFLCDIEELKDIHVKDGFIIIGSACTCSTIASSEKLSDFIKEVFLKMSSPAVRNMATIGGNICNSSPAGDSLPLLYVLEAKLILKSIDGIREIAIQDFIKGPGRNEKKCGEILTSIKIPIPNFNITYYKKVGTRKANALSKLSFIGLARTRDKFLYDVRIALGAVGPTVVRDRGIENEIIKMKTISVQIDAKAITDMYLSIIKPIDDQRSTALYRKNAALRLIEDFLNNIR